MSQETYETYTVRDTRTGKVLQTDIVDWAVVEAYLAQDAAYEYITSNPL
ncbi:hypothetical protein MF628_004933 [Paenibacillus polymyxa]|nr:hypothetical protein [Paenibacillus polymyxa]URJ45151.1 hypothetical protein MF628_004933 [Paenibacillus polymyxa]